MTNAITLSVSDLTTQNPDEPRILDTRIAKSLGMSRPRVIRELIKRNKEELERYGSLAVRHGKSRGQEFSEYHLTEGQALCLAALSDAPNAPAARQMLIEIFIAYRRGQLAQAALDGLRALPDGQYLVTIRGNRPRVACEANGCLVVDPTFPLDILAVLRSLPPESMPLVLDGVSAVLSAGKQPWRP